MSEKQNNKNKIILKSTSNNRNAHVSVAIDKYVHGVFKRLVIQQQRRYILKHYPCSPPNLKKEKWPWRKHKTEKQKKKKKRKPGIGKSGTTRIALEMPCSLGSPLSPFSAANIFRFSKTLWLIYLSISLFL